MPPTPPSHEDALDLDGLDLKPSGAKSKAAAESDFEKELEALFAEELASSDEKPASAPPVGAPELEEDALLLDDLVPDAPPVSVAADEEDILDLSAFAAGGELELTPPEETPGGKDGDIDLGGLDELISGLGDAKTPAAAPAQSGSEPMDAVDVTDLLETLDMPVVAPQAAAAPAPAPESEEDLLELSLGDLVEEALQPEPVAAPVAEPMATEAAADLSESVVDTSILDLVLPDLSDPEPGRDLVAEQESTDIGGEMNLSLSDLVEEPPAHAADSGAAMDQLLDSSDLDMTGLMEGIETSAGEPAAELSLDPQDLLAQLADTPGEAFAGTAPGAPEPLLEPGFDAHAVELEAMRLADAALGSVTARVAPAGVAASGDLAGLQERLAQLATQVTGNSVAVMRLEGQLAERDKILADLEERLLASQTEAQSLREKLADLRAHMEQTLSAQSDDVRQQLAQSTQASADKAQAAMDKALGAMDKALAALDKAQAVADKVETLAPRVESAEMTVRGAGARLAQMENRQSQMDREVFAEISRAVPREAAKVIREEIAHLAASMRDE